jgi:hypothetical protein
MYGVTHQDCSRGGSRPSGVKRLVGVYRIAAERRERGVFGNSTHQDFIIDAVLHMMELSLGEKRFQEPAKNIERAIQELIQTYQAQLIDLGEKKHMAELDAQPSRQWLTKHAKKNRVTTTVYVPQKSFVERVTTQSFTQSTKFRTRAQKAAAVVEDVKMNGDGASSKSKKVYERDRLWLQAHVAKYKKLKPKQHVVHAFALNMLKDIASLDRDEKVDRANIHVARSERAADLESQLSRLEQQLDAFYKWRKTDNYRQMIAAYQTELRHEGYVRAHSVRMLANG